MKERERRKVVKDRFSKREAATVRLQIMGDCDKEVSAARRSISETRTENECRMQAVGMESEYCGTVPTALFGT